MFCLSRLNYETSVLIYLTVVVWVGLNDIYIYQYSQLKIIMRTTPVLCELHFSRSWFSIGRYLIRKIFYTICKNMIKQNEIYIYIYIKHILSLQVVLEIWQDSIVLQKRSGTFLSTCYYGSSQHFRSKIVCTEKFIDKVGSILARLLLTF